MTISTEGGIWIEIPYNDGEEHHEQEFYYNIANSQIAVTGVNHHNQPYLQIYRDFDFYKAKVAKHSLRCRLVSVN